METPDKNGAVVQSLAREIAQTHGELISCEALSSILGYKSAAAVRQALHKRALPLRTFEVPGRRGRFSSPQDVAGYVVAVRTPE